LAITFRPRRPEPWAATIRLSRAFSRSSFAEPGVVGLGPGLLVAPAVIGVLRGLQLPGDLGDRRAVASIRSASRTLRITCSGVCLRRFNAQSTSPIITGAKTERRGSGHGSFSLAAEESGLSRVLIGFHFCKAVEAAIEHARDRQPRGRPLPAARARGAGTSRGPMTTRHRVVPVGGAVRTEIERVHAATTAAWARRLVNGGAGRATFWLARSRGWCRRRGR
jgi:hypothetical protein